MQRLLLDTNIVIDYLAQRQPFYVMARRLMVLGAIGEVELWISASQINDVFYIASEGGRTQLGQLVQERLRKCRAFLHICPLDERDVDVALEKDWDDLEDACVEVCANKLKADWIITRDAGFRDSSIQAIDASRYFEWLKDKRGVSYTELTLGADE